jgi:hypothetical protein
MSNAQAEAAAQEIDVEGLATWLDDLPNDAERRRLAVPADRAAEQLENLSKNLTVASDSLRSIQAGLNSLGLPRFDPRTKWEDLQDGLDKLPKVEVRALASFAEGHGRTLPNQAERLTRAVEAHWLDECNKLSKHITAPLRMLLAAMEREHSVSKPTLDTLRLLIKRIEFARNDMSSNPGTAPNFLAAQKAAQDYLARALSGAPDPAMLVRRLASGELRLGALSEMELDALRSSPLAHAIALKL